MSLKITLLSRSYTQSFLSIHRRLVPGYPQIPKWEHSSLLYKMMVVSAWNVCISFCILWVISRLLVIPAATAKSPQPCPTLCDLIDGSPPGSPFPGILQARTLDWVAISFSSAWKWKVKMKSLSHVWLLATLWTAAHQAPPSMGFSRQECWMGCHCLLQRPGTVKQIN